jgi:hypothetical protein
MPVPGIPLAQLGQSFSACMAVGWRDLDTAFRSLQQLMSSPGPPPPFPPRVEPTATRGHHPWNWSPRIECPWPIAFASTAGVMLLPLPGAWRIGIQSASQGTKQTAGGKGHLQSHG